mmetsp:Transcript_5952/g.15308  ORF Transcript_5952/g.15308 Transcript_5952/m.15308 type:complete len:216 (-) Transcript_5952:849-1496(-)
MTSRKTPKHSVLFIVTAPYTWLKVSEMFFERFFDANWRDDTNSEELLASGVTTKATKKEGMPLAVEKFLTASTMGSAKNPHSAVPSTIKVTAVLTICAGVGGGPSSSSTPSSSSSISPSPPTRGVVGSSTSQSCGAAPREDRRLASLLPPPPAARWCSFFSSIHFIRPLENSSSLITSSLSVSKSAIQWSTSSSTNESSEMARPVNSAWSSRFSM